MRVEERRNREVNLNNILIDSSAKKVSVASSPFAAMLEEEKEIRKYSYELDELKRQIYDAGNMLERSANIKEFQRFRDLIGSLVDKVVKDGYRVRNLTMGTKSYNVIATINKELSDLQKEIMEAQKDHIAIANKVMRLKGLVLNLVL